VALGVGAAVGDSLALRGGTISAAIVTAGVRAAVSDALAAG
jgi:hypothetical protein